MSSSDDAGKIARYADLQGVSVGEFLARVTRYAEGFPTSFEEAASHTAGKSADEINRMADALSDSRRDAAYVAALRQIAEDRRTYGAP